MLAHRRLVVAFILSLLAVAPRAADAQMLAGSFTQLQVLVKPGDTVRVTDSTGREITAKVAELTPSTLALLAGNTRVEMQEDEVKTILQRRPDSLKEGALWGLAVGAGLATVAILASDGLDHEDAGWLLAAAGLYGGIGAGIGVGIDAMMDSWLPIYARPAPSSRGLSVSPFMAPHHAGVRVSWRF